MDVDNKASKLHPLAIAAAAAVILVSLTGVAAMTGVLPNFSKSATPEATTTAAAETATSAPVTDSASASTAAETPASTTKTAAKKPTAKPTYTSGSNAPIYADNQVSQANANPEPIAPPAPPPCPNCGVVETTRTIQQQAPASGIGAGVGALLGGVLGHQVGGGNGRTLATVAGAIGGGLAGNAVEKNTHTTTTYEVIVRMEDGTKQRFILSTQRWRSGDLVRVDNGNLSSRDH
ncbi:glycine zipper 2TM domain-containing protein [Solimicrobium silvestre]|uniref:Glycine zipper 2TM domain n=1 Tax=Solimicrobium silvestre TaxID=2099400 RepID=A0A2S9GYH2_9BURK|nr:glycine zipper 2TM domain-containing protein [Solimicrobium silvestre]PRC92761.1 Glycine zipper 2TM domain [Solimicrobium silvestre]